MADFETRRLEDHELAEFLALHEVYVENDGAIPDPDDHAEFARLLAKARADLTVVDGDWLVSCALDGYHEDCLGSMHLAHATIDHVILRTDGGSHDAENLQTACTHCNSSKNGA